MSQLEGTSLFLVGMMGSGKSTVGQLVASHLGYAHVDSDALVSAAAGGASVASLFASEGEAGFRDLESRVLNEVSAYARLVVSTGGGAVVRPSNWAHLRHGVVVFLDAPVALLAARVVADGPAKRPLLASAPPGGEAAHAEAVLSAIFDQRKALYAEADVRVEQQPVGDAAAGLACEPPAATAARLLAAVSATLAADDVKRRLREVPKAGDIALGGTARGPVHI